MKKIIGFIILGMFILSGCKSFSRNMEHRAISLAPLIRDDYIIAQDITGTATIKYIFGIPISGGNKYGMIGVGDGGLFDELSTAEREAIHNAIESAPEGADAIIAPRFETKTSRIWPFYSSEEVTVKGKSLKIRTDIERLEAYIKMKDLQ